MSGRQITSVDTLIITFNEVKAQKNHFSSYIQWFEFIEDSAIFKRRVKNKKVNQINARSWRLLTDKPKSRNQF